MSEEFLNRMQGPFRGMLHWCEHDCTHCGIFYADDAPLPGNRRRWWQKLIGG